MKHHNIKSIGKVILLIGILAFILGISMLFFAAFSPAFAIIIMSIILNIVGITLVTTKIRD